MGKSSFQKRRVEVSVVIPAYNAAAYLRQAIESVFEQTLKNVELIVVDDGSIDETSAVAKSFGSRVRYFFKENGGVASARNYGLKKASGEFIASLDADDFFVSPTKLESQLELIKQFDDCGLVISGWLNVDAGGAEIEKREPWKYAAQLDLKDMITWNPFLTSVLLFRRTALEKVGGYDERIKIIEDSDTVIRLILAGYTAKWLPQITTAYRLHTGNNTRNLRRMERETENYLTEFFKRDCLPVEVKKIERKIRFSNRIRMAFKYLEAEEFSEMKRCLLSSIEFSDTAHGGNLFYWFESFRQYKPKINLFGLLDGEQWRELMDLQLNTDSH